MSTERNSQFNNPELYEQYVGRWSRRVARQFLTWLNAPPGLRWLDVGAGTGVLTQAILDHANPAAVVGIDTSAEFLGVARQTIQDERVEFRHADASALALPAPAFEVAVAGLVLNFLPDPEAAVQTMATGVVENGTLAAYVWDYGGRMEMMRHFWDAAAVVDPASRALDPGQRFAIAKPEALRVAFEAADLAQVETTAIDIETIFQDFDDYWAPILGAQGSLSKYVRDMSDATRAALQNQLRAQLPIRTDGTILLKGRAWAVKGVKP
jgi:trans-aconitate methyltransferase